MRLGSLTIDSPVALAPLAGYSHLPMRLLSRLAGAGLVYTEMLSATALHYGSAATEGLMATCPQERPVGFQLFGSEPAWMAQAARQCREAGADLVDLNLGCAVPKVLKAGAGAALLADPGRAAAIVAAVAEAVDCPVTVKLRAGRREGDEEWLALAVRLAESGAAALTVHGRTVAQRFTGACSLESIRRAVAAVPVPVFGNGDVDSPEAAERMLEETGCAGVMIGRAAIGNPWLFGAVAARLAGRPAPPQPSAAERVTVAGYHAALLIAERGEATGLRESRATLSHYLAGLPYARGVRRALFKLERWPDVQALLRVYARALALAPPKEAR